MYRDKKTGAKLGNEALVAVLVGLVTIKVLME
jgi:hypothetical protein